MASAPSKFESFRREDAGYEAARRATCRNAHLPDRYPDIIVQAATEADVVAAVRLAKDLIKNGRRDVPGRIEEELALFQQRLRSAEAAEAFQAFMEKRKPDFSRFS